MYKLVTFKHNEQEQIPNWTELQHVIHFNYYLVATASKPVDVRLYHASPYPCCILLWGMNTTVHSSFKFDNFLSLEFTYCQIIVGLNYSNDYTFNKEGQLYRILTQMPLNWMWQRNFVSEPF